MKQTIKQSAKETTAQISRLRSSSKCSSSGALVASSAASSSAVGLTTGQVRVRGCMGAFRSERRLVFLRRGRDQHDDVLPAENIGHLPGARQRIVSIRPKAFPKRADLSHLRG